MGRVKEQYQETLEHEQAYLEQEYQMEFWYNQQSQQSLTADEINRLMLNAAEMDNDIIDKF